jgi:hypothetical protein
MQQTKKLMLGIVVMLISALTVSAQKGHFVGGKASSSTDNGTTLTSCGKIAGLGDNQNVCLTLHATATVYSECTNNGGNVAPGQTTTLNIVKSGTYTSDKNGNVNFCLETDVPAPGACPPNNKDGNWIGRVTDVSFADFSVTFAPGDCSL